MCRSIKASSSGKGRRSRSSRRSDSSSDDEKGASAYTYERAAKRAYNIVKDGTITTFSWMTLSPQAAFLVFKKINAEVWELSLIHI